MPDAGGEEVPVRGKSLVRARKGLWGRKGRWALGGESGLDDSQLDARGGGENWGGHGEGEEVEDGRKSLKPVRRGGKPAEKQALKTIIKEGVL